MVSSNIIGQFLLSYLVGMLALEHWNETAPRFLALSWQIIYAYTSKFKCVN